MATSGSKSVSFTSWDTLKFSWTEVSQSIDDNTTEISWELELVATDYGRINATSTCPWEVTVNGTEYSGSVNVGISNNTTKTLASGTTTIAHNADGSKTFSYSFNQYFGITFSGEWIANVGGSGTGTLDTIPRASQPSLVTYPNSTANIGDFGETFSIHMNTASQSFTHTVRYEYGSRTGTIATGVVNGTTWAVPLEFMNDIPNATSGSGRIYVDTYSGSTLVGTKYTGFTATVPASVKPSCSFVLEDITGVDDIYGSPVKGLSKIKITVTGKTAYSSPIASYAITANGVKYSDATATTGILLTAGTSTVKATVTDKRGRSGSVSYDMTVQDYTAPKITALAVHRCDKDGTTNNRGEYVKVTFSAAVSSMDSKNTATYALKYKKSADTSWTTLTTDANGKMPSSLNGSYSVSSASYIFAADGSSSYDVEVSVTDRHDTASRTTSASTAFTLINYHPKGNALRFGGVAEKENTFQNDLDFWQTGNHYAFQPDSFSGAKGYTLLAVIVVKSLNSNAPIVFQINRRGAICPMNVYVRFASSSSTTDPDLGSITYEGDNFGAFLVKSAASTWKLYVDNITGWTNPCLQDWYTTDNQMSRISVEFSNEQVDGTDPSVLGTYYRATPAVMQSIIDCLLPVGTIIQRYDHADPNTMYPGTTWERLENAFLWATTSGGTIGQTGGEKTHILTKEEMPKHSHGAVYTGASKIYTDGYYTTEVEKNYAWFTTSQGSSMGYGTVPSGEGQAHNNMPPYIQVSVWRRTA